MDKLVNLALLTCRSYQADPRVGSVTHLEWLTAAYYAMSLPATIPDLCVYWMVTNIEPGEYPLQLGMFDRFDNQIGELIDWTIRPRATWDRVEKVAVLSQRHVRQFGQYNIRVLRDGLTVVATRFFIHPEEQRDERSTLPVPV